VLGRLPVELGAPVADGIDEEAAARHVQ
jgi:hypothetical protein